jgi:hypothetical protein
MATAYHKIGPQRKGVERVKRIRTTVVREVPIPKVDTAIESARRGLSVFLLNPGSSDPLIQNWRDVATTDPDQIRECWALCADANVGISTKELLTLRITERCPPTTVAQLKSLFDEHDVPKSVCTMRPRPADGIEICLHFSLPVGAAVEAKSDVLFAGIDVLSNNDFVIGPGSVLDDGMCKFANNNSLSQASPWLMEMCGVEMPAESKSMNVVALKKPAPPAPVKTKLEWALEASEHVPVHPCRWYVDPGPNANPDERKKAIRAAKEPLTKWKDLATQDSEQIRKWWGRWPDANIGGVTNQLLVVDVDKQNGGCETFEFLRLVEDFPETMTNNTQGGGQHLFYVMRAGEPLKNGTHTLGPGIDVKTDGGYVMMPGSTIEGRSYTRANDAPIAFAPPGIVEQCKNARPKPSAAGKRVVEEDDTAIELFTKWIRDRAPYAELGKIDDTTFIVCARGYDFGCSQETVYEKALGWNETHCNGLGDLERLAVVVESAGRNRQRPIGCDHPLAPGFDAVEIDESKAPLAAEIDESEASTAAAPIPTAKSGDLRAWENEPNAIFVDHLKPADLPAGVLPEVVEQFAHDSARRLGVDAGAPAAALVTALGSLVPAGNRLQMRQRDTKWTVKPILWTAIIAPSGSNKSATINAAMDPVKTLQKKWRKTFTTDEHKRKLDEARRATAEKANKAKPENTDQVFEGEAEAEKPRFRQKIYNDATTEALAVALCENPEGLLYHADELAGWLAGMDAYRAKGGKDRAFWLQAKEGGDFTVNRKLSERICVENCAISVLGGIQPDKIKALKTSMSDDGLLQRFTPIVLHRWDNGADIDPDKALDDRVAIAANAIADAANGTLFRFSPEADAELHAVEAFKAKEIARPDASPTLRQWLDKMPNEFGRLSLVFHFIEHYGASGAAVDTLPAAIIGRCTAERARRYLTEFVYSHALTFYLKDLGASTMDEHALWIAGFVLARGLPAISTRDIYRVYPALKSPEKRSLIVATMRVLEMHDWVKPAHIDRHGAEDRWTVNPAVHDGRFAEIAATERRRRDGVQESIKQGAAA